MPDNQSSAPISPRIDLIDAARGCAMLAMFVYHFCWNLAYFRYLGRDVVEASLWRGFAMSIAASFLFLVGVSLVLATRNGVRWNSFFKRLGSVIASALLVTIVTYFLFPTSFIFFGILHSIAAASVLGLAFLHMPLVLIAVAAFAVFLAPHIFADPYFNAWAWRWLGLMTYFPQTNDYEPVLPWFSATLTGILVARVAIKTGAMEQIAQWQATTYPARILCLGGRHSLIIYLVHQPILFGLVWLAALIAPAPGFGPITAERYHGICTSNCIEGGYDNKAFCTVYCTCLQETLTNEGLMASILANELTSDQQSKIGETAYWCQEQAETAQ